MRDDLNRIADRLIQIQKVLSPMQVVGGNLTPLETRGICRTLDQCITEARMASRRCGEMLEIIAAHGRAIAPPPPRQRLRVIEGGTTLPPRPGIKTRRGAPTAPDDPGPRAA